MAATTLRPYSERITHDPQVMGGKACIRGLRVTVGMILGRLASGETASEIREAFPYLEPADIAASLEYAAWRVQESESFIPR
ncbi:MAG TPA: DUF433 domain-containing protein [Tepidiformaceae bacterium]|nr:DUF433 domain-containing protein [Tepidiformaceae bacterium]HMO95425.1 DUF433 domain-containing protein [Tepidiformaceae bacterium]